MTTISMLIGLSMFIWVPMFTPTGFAQTEGSTQKENAPNNIKKKDSLLLSRLRNTRIVFKDGSIRKNCKVKEINDYWIVYEKEGSLHDLMIEKVSRIEIGDGTMQAVFFDEKNKPGIRTNGY
jgi:hypothetical protein